jgi:hypothetical protein
MSVSGIGAATAPSLTPTVATSHHHRNKTHAPSISDGDAQTSSAAANSKNRLGSQLDVKF